MRIAYKVTSSTLPCLPPGKTLQIAADDGGSGRDAISVYVCGLHAIGFDKASKNRVEAPSDWPVEGLLVHIAGDGPDGFRVVDVWESEDAVRQFGEIGTLILQELGVDGQPEVYPAHVFVSA